ncbi:MAG: helix-turn-helix domain-containing protein, partial [Pyrinomonadaceae bacterium]
ANLRGKLDKVTIVFKPLGLNHFVRRPFSAICPNDSQLFIEWNEAESYPTFLDDFYATDDQAKRCDLLEDFLLSLHRPIENGVKLQNAISLLIDFEKALSIEEIACAIGLTTRTFNRLFRDNLGISPIGFRKIARFRHSLNFKLFDEQFKRLTDVAYNSNFYDQSYFISIYKKMTGSNPKMFFEEVERVGADKLLFQFLKS